MYPVSIGLTGVVVDRPTMTTTRGGTPRSLFNLVVRGRTLRRYFQVIAYGTVAELCERSVGPGQRVRVEGTALPAPRFPRELHPVGRREAAILARSVRKVQTRFSLRPRPMPALSAAAEREAAVPVTAPAAEAIPQLVA
jgi:hypothetical protein